MNEVVKVPTYVLVGLLFLAAIGLLAGLYAGLIRSGFWYGFSTAGLLYDGLLHMIFVGFVFSMVFAHVPVIIPSLSGKMVSWHGYFYLPLILLHVFLTVRVFGDLMLSPLVRTIGSHGNVLAIILFLAGVLYQLVSKAFEKKKFKLKQVDKSY